MKRALSLLLALLLCLSLLPAALAEGEPAGEAAEEAAAIPEEIPAGELEEAPAEEPEEALVEAEEAPAGEAEEVPAEAEEAPVEAAEAETLEPEAETAPRYEADEFEQERPTITQEGRALRISWDAVPGADRYRVYRAEAGPTWVVLATVKTNEYLYTNPQIGVERFKISYRLNGVWSAKGPMNWIDYSPFTDVKPSSPHFSKVMWAYNNKITSGTGDGSTFSPDDCCTRGQFAIMLYRLAGKPSVAGMKHPFTDVSASYAKAVTWAYNKKIISGTSASTFSPEDNVTRYQVLLMLWKLVGRPKVSGVENPFDDVDPGAAYYKAVMWAYKNKITTGTSYHTFSPDADCTRLQLVIFLCTFNRLMHYI